MNKIVGIVSGKGGVGKTTLCANLAFALAGMNKKVMVIDGDLNLKNLDILLGMTDNTVFDLTDVLSGGCRLDKAVVSHESYPNLHFISAPAGPVSVPRGIEKFGDLCERLKEAYDFVLVDAPAGVGGWVRTIIKSCDECIVVATPDLTSLRDAQRMSQITAEYGIKARLVLNRVVPKMINRGLLSNVDDMMDSISLPLIGLLPLDEKIIVYSNSGRPAVGSDSVCSEPFRNIARRLCGQKAPLGKYWRKNKK